MLNSAPGEARLRDLDRRDRADPLRIQKPFLIRHRFRQFRSCSEALRSRSSSAASAGLFSLRATGNALECVLSRCQHGSCRHQHPSQLRNRGDDPPARVYLVSQSTSLGRAAAAGFAGLLLICSPLAWFHGTVALTYIVEAMFSSLIGYFCWRVYIGASRSLILPGRGGPGASRGIPAIFAARLGSRVCVFDPARSPQTCIMGIIRARASL